MSLRASKTGCLPVSDIYNFMMENFPYFKTAPDGWKNSVRHNLSLNKCFEKVNLILVYFYEHWWIFHFRNHKITRLKDNRHSRR